jgi:hypothetical protein
MKKAPPDRSHPTNRRSWNSLVPNREGEGSRGWRVIARDVSMDTHRRGGGRAAGEGERGKGGVGAGVEVRRKCSFQMVTRRERE